MTISEYIRELEAIRAEHGELEIETYGLSCGRCPASTPTIAYKKILAGRQRRPAFWSYDLKTKGEKVVRV